MTDRDKLRTLIRWRDAVVTLISAGGSGIAVDRYRAACHEVLAMALMRKPSNDELDDLLCERRTTP
jgi:hypothetical protein